MSRRHTSLQTAWNDPVLTTADAGNTSTSKASLKPLRAHPRGRGEHLDFLCLLGAEQGSPPRTRGTRLIWLHEGSPTGLTPADAGNTRSYKWLIVRIRAHPRGRGEHDLLGFRRLVIVGSPPRTRGTQPAKWKGDKTAGLTPADAGNTRFAAQSRGLTRAHPRGRGEHGIFLSRGVLGAGSPPRTRGTRDFGVCHGVTYGLTPADAGNTFRPSLALSCSGAHPRGRGEHADTACDRSNLSGLTPADAGNTAFLDFGLSKYRAHPRGRGERTS